MLLITLLTTLFTLTTATALPNPPPTPPSPCTAAGYLDPDATPLRTPLALIDIYTSANCTPTGSSPASTPATAAVHCQLPIYDSGTCIPFMANTQTLRVVRSDKAKLKYNSLRVYRKADCTGGWALEPHMCQGANGDGQCACSSVPSKWFRSIQVVLD